jgi:hypothetical protein
VTLKKSNPHLKTAAARKAALLVSAKTSSAVEGIRAPFARASKAGVPTSAKALIAHWKRRVGATSK